MRQCLIVDDSRVIRKLACRILEDLDYVTAEADDRDSALEQCRSNMPDVILLDGDMPNSNGIEFVRALRGDKNGAKPVVIYCATEVNVPLITQALTSGANEYLLKPYDKSDVKAKLASLGLA